jgi:hypothetical protein
MGRPLTVADNEQPPEGLRCRSIILQSREQHLIASVKARNVDIAIVESEVILRADATVAQLIDYINEVREAAPDGRPGPELCSWQIFRASFPIRRLLRIRIGRPGG